MAAVNTSRLSLYFSIKGVAGEMLGKCQLTIFEDSLNGRVVGSTEILDANLAPNEGARAPQQPYREVAFTSPISVNYSFEHIQTFRLVLSGCSGQHFTTVADVIPMASLLRSPKMVLNIAAPQLSPMGEVSISAVDKSITRGDTADFVISVEDLPETCGCCSSAPTVGVELKRILSTGQRLQLHSTEMRTYRDGMQWKLPPIRISDLISADMSENTIEFAIVSKGSFGKKVLGTLVTSLNSIQSCQASRTSLRLSDASRRLLGYVKFLECRINRGVSFSKFLSSGWQFNLLVAVDFTASNGDPRDPKSLHHVAAEPNEYIKTIMAVGSIVLEYDSDKMVAGFGFGAELPDGRTSHFFHLNLQPNPYVHGIEGLLDSYKRSLNVVKFSGPTNFAPTIRNVTAGAMKAELDHIYTILLIITDGEISDIDDTIDALVKADDVALSIIIVGVGSDCDFEAMKQLDGDDSALVSCGRKSRRDLVQFVPMKEFTNSPVEALGAEVLREIPAQVERWASLKGIGEGLGRSSVTV